MSYEYGGYWPNIAPPAAPPEQVNEVVFDTEDIARWPTKDRATEQQWQRIPAARSTEGSCVRLVGRFADVKRIDSLPPTRPGFWVALSTLGIKDERLPIDATRLPVVEISYRCTSEGAHPVLVLTHAGGAYRADLMPSPSWRTVALRIERLGFPACIDGVIFRLYSASRTTQSLELQRVRFRAMTPEEAQACAADDQRMESQWAPKNYPVLDDFIPLGVTMDAAAGRRLSEILDVSMPEYWGLALEDIVKHHHNTVLMENASHMSRGEWDEFIRHAGDFGLKVIPQLALPVEGSEADLAETFERYIEPYKEDPTVLAWTFAHPPAEKRLPAYLRLRRRLEKADAIHPLSVGLSTPGILPLYSPYFSVASMNYDSAHEPWSLGRMVREHLPLVRGRQLWVVAATYVEGTGAPEWNSSPEMRLMVNLSFANGARGWINRYYHNDPVWAGGGYERSLTGPFLAFSDLWAELDHCMERFNAIAPLLLHSRPEELGDEWCLTSSSAQENAHLPEGFEPMSAFRLCGDDYELRMLVSNDVRGIVSGNVEVAAGSLRGLEIYDLTDFVRSRKWVSMPLQRHVEMFPGQVRVVLAGAPRVCSQWRDAIALHLAEDDRRQLAFNLQLAQAYGLDISGVEKMIENVDDASDLMKLEIMDHARDMLTDLIYQSEGIQTARSSIIEASAAACACDGILCRLMSRGESEKAHEYGRKLTAVAREFTHLRLELRQGRAVDIAGACQDVRQRAHALLAELRTLSPTGGPEMNGLRNRIQE